MKRILKFHLRDLALAACTFLIAIHTILCSPNLEIASQNILDGNQLIDIQTDSVDTIDLPEITVKGERKYSALELGFYNKNFFDLFGASTIIINSDGFSELYVFIEGREGINYLKAVQLAIDKKGSKGLFRLRLRTVDKNGFPGADLLNEGQIFDMESLPHEINIEEYNIPLPPEGIFVGVEAVDQAERNFNSEDYSIGNDTWESTFQIKATDGYKTKVFTWAKAMGKWIKHNEDSIPRIGLIVKAY